MQLSFRFFTVLQLFLIIVVFQTTKTLFAQTDGERSFIILEPVDSAINSYPILRRKPLDDTIGKVVYDLSQYSAMQISVGLYLRVQYFLVNNGKQEYPEPAYLLLSQHQGGFPRYGFNLLSGDSLIDKTQVSYVELVKNKPGPEDHLGSITQMYPHEMGHVLYQLLCKDSDSLVPGATDIHYSTLVTDFRTAFNEGFAMHFENMARKHEPDPNRKKQIMEDFDRKKEKAGHRIRPFIRDFIWPIRMGLYRASMIFWYQDYEDIKRFEWVNENRVKFLNLSRIFGDAENSLYLRNAGIETSEKMRNLQQICSTEGMVASFFVKLMNSDLKNRPVDSALLRAFSEPGKKLEEPDPLENEYIKIFHVLHKHVNRSLTSQSQILDFIEGYRNEFPGEASAVDSIFLDWSGYSWPVDPGPELWITNKDHKHGLLVLDQFGGITLPYYTFNLNAATEADLLTFPGIDRQSAGSMIHFINQNGPLENLDELDHIQGISESSIQILKKNKFDPDFFRNFDEYKLNLTISSLLSTSLFHLLKWFSVWFVILLAMIMAVYHFIFKQRFTLKKSLYLFIRYLGFFLIALAVLVLSTEILLWYAIFGSVFLFAQFMFFRKKEDVFAGLVGTVLILVVIGYSLV